MQPYEFIFEKNTVYNNNPDPFFVDKPTLQHYTPEYYGRGAVYVEKDESGR